MSRLHRGLWFVEAHMADGSVFLTQPVGYDQAAIEVAQLGHEGVIRAVLRRVPGSRAPWERRAPYEASDPPRWGDEE